MERVGSFPASDFDQWADSNDDDVVVFNRFPFAGCHKILESVLCTAAPRTGLAVHSFGTGTGHLARLFLEAGCRVCGVDCCPAMLAKVKLKSPEATLVLHDVRAAWPTQLDRRFDRIASGYTFQHVELDRNVQMLAAMSELHLEVGNRIVNADVSFPSLPGVHEFAATVGDLWEDEPYWQADEALRAVRDAGLECSYEQVSPCGGVYRIEPA